MHDSSTQGVLLSALDPLFFRDGRPFDATQRVSSSLPHPQTLAGAIRTAILAEMGFDFAALAKLQRQHRDSRNRDQTKVNIQSVLARQGFSDDYLELQVRGPWMALVPPSHLKSRTIEPLLPVPSVLTRIVLDDDQTEGPVFGTWGRLHPRETGLRGWKPPLPEMHDLQNPFLPLWQKANFEAKNPGGYLTLSGMRKFLAGETPTDEDWFQDEDLRTEDRRVGIEICAETFSTIEGQLYGIHFLALNPKIEREHFASDAEYQGWSVALYAEIAGWKDTAGSLDRRPIPFGGEGKYVLAQTTSTVDWNPAVIPPGPSTKSLLYLATPGLFTDSDQKSSWRPDYFSKPGAARLRAAASGVGVAISGWDGLRMGPKPTRFAVPAGGVYFVEGTVELDQGSLCGDPEDIAQGWGLALQGVWK